MLQLKRADAGGQVQQRQQHLSSEPLDADSHQELVVVSLMTKLR